MQEFVNFIKEYGALILAALSVLVGIICAVIKNRPKTMDDFIKVVSDCLVEVPNCCAAVEKIVGAGQGSLKRSIVLNQLSLSVSNQLGRALTGSEESYVHKKGVLLLEATLRAPQRKEVSDDTKNSG